ncbi:MAG: nucleotide exchange factor GrpE [Isosphaeraceae bacterium]
MNETHTEDVEGLLARFRDWLEETRIEAGRIERLADGADRDSAGDRLADAPIPGAEFGLIQLAEEFTAVRHELKLQTKSGRGLLEQAEAMVSALRQAIEQFRSVEPKESQAAWASGKPIAEALGDLHEALDRGRRAIERAAHRVVEETTEALETELDRQFRGQSWLRRRMTAEYHRQVLDVVREAGQARRELFESLLEGYGLIQNRLGRVMKAERIERIPCEGNPVDPERMIVLEVVEAADRPPGTVVKELRSGYTWKGRLLRYAEVQAASAVRAPAPEPVEAVEGPDQGEDEHAEDDESAFADADAEALDEIQIGNGDDNGDTSIDLHIDTERDRGVARAE